MAVLEVSSIAGLLTLYLDGKNVEREDLISSIGSISPAEKKSVDDLFLLVLHQYISEGDFQKSS